MEFSNIDYILIGVLIIFAILDVIMLTVRFNPPKEVAETPLENISNNDETEKIIENDNNGLNDNNTSQDENAQ